MNPLANLNFQNGDKEFFVVEEISIKIFVHLMVHDMVNLLYDIYSCKILYLEFVSFFKLIHWDQLTGTCKWPWHSEAAELFTEVKYTCRTYARTMTQRG